MQHALTLRFTPLGTDETLENVQRKAFGCETPCMGCTLGCGMNVVEELRAAFTDPSSGLAKPAAFLLEPIQAEGGVRVASKEFLLGIQKLARELGSLVILDDIQAGCGRTGRYFSFDDMGLDPDIVTLAKGIGGFGTPLAMNLVKPEHDDHWKPGQHTGTFRGQGFSFVAGKIALEYFEDEGFLKGVRAMGAQMKEGLEAIAKKHASKHPMQVRGRGMMQAIDLGDADVTGKVVKHAFDNGLLIGSCGGGKVIKLIPPLTIPDADLKAGMDQLAASIDAVVG